MKKVFLTIVGIALFFGACKNETKSAVIQNVNVETNKEFKVKIKYKTNKAGTFRLALYNIFSNESQNKRIQINEEVVATPTMDNLTAHFGKNISNSFSIGFGNKEVQEVQIEFIEISYGQKAIKINSSELNEYFKMNEFVAQDKKTYKLKTQKIDNKLNPKLFLKKEYLIELKKE
jgi:hypothetical protein